MPNKWSVKKMPDDSHYPGRWGVFDDGNLYDVADCLYDAHTYATQLAVADVLFNPGGLTWLSALQGLARTPRLDPEVVW